MILMIFNISSLNASEYTKGFMLYKKGSRFLNKDKEKADKYFAQSESPLLAAYKSDKSANAAFMLGKMYCNGWGVPKDYNKAIKYFHDAISWGNKRSNCCLARLYIMYLKQNIKDEGQKHFKIAQQYHIPDCKDIKAYIKQNHLFDIN